MLRRDKYYKRWTRSGRPTDQKKFFDYKHLIRRVSERAYEKYLGDILGLNQETDDLDTPSKVNNNKLYSLLKHSKQNSRGISSLKADGKTFSSESDKANALNLQFQPLFSPKSPISLNSLAKRTLQDLHDSGTDLPFQPSPHPKMPDIQISTKGTESPLKKLNHHKAASPDQIKSIVLQTLHKQLALILHVIFQRSINQGKLPNIGKMPMCLLYLKRVTSQNPQTTDPSFLHMFYIKY